MKKTKYLILSAAIMSLNSCKTTDRSDWTLYQPEQLFLKGGVAIDTVNGKYAPQTDEVWHSTKTVNDLEKRLTSK